VLTEPEFFQGSLHNLQLASGSATLPCIRKDFIVDEFQILDARANCADAVLLITAVLSQAELAGLLKAAREQQLDVLCEVHTEEELRRALDAGCDVIGVNSRDLRTFTVDLEAAFRLAKLIPDNVLAVAESGIHEAADIARLRSCGYDAFLIGESLMRSVHPGEMLKNLVLQAATPVAAF
jgi:indole-3-glycerol phosphate synthase